MIVTAAFILTSCEDVKAGKNALTSIVDEEAGENCADGGLKIETGLDSNFNGKLDETEVNDTKYICDGEEGEKGSTGATGENGTNGTDGADGEDGKNGEDGEKGDPGADGVCAGNSAPLINLISMPAASPRKGESFDITINATDSDVSDILDYSLVGSEAEIVQNATEKNKYTITPVNGTVYNFSVMVSDGCEISTKQLEFTAYITDADTLTDPITGKMWQLNKSDTESNWTTANAYCENLNLAGYTDWRMPKISEIRTTIKECPSTMTGGTCKVTDPDHLAFADHDGNCTCGLDYSGKYSIFGDTDNLWSASFQSDDTAFVWTTNLHYAYIGHYSTNGDNNKVRCIRN